MADTDDADISNMPAPPDELVNTAAPDISDMPSPTDVFKQHVGREPENDTELGNFMARPEDFAGGGAPKSAPGAFDLAAGTAGAAEEVAKQGTGALAAIPAGIAYGGAAIAKAFGKDVDPAQVQRDVSAYLTYKPSSPAAKAAEDALEKTYGPAWHAIVDVADKAAKQVGKTSPTAETYLREAPAAAQAALGVTPLVGAAAGLAARGAEAKVASTPETPATPPAAPTEATPAVEGPVSGADLRAQPDPLPPPEQAPQPAAPAPGPVARQPVPGKPHIRLKAQQPVAAELQSGENPTSVAPEAQTAPEAANAPTGAGANVRFTPPSAEGAISGPAEPEVQASRTKTLRDLDKLGNGQLGEVRTSAISGHTQEAGTDYQHAQIRDAGGDRMQDVIANETNTLRAAADNLTTKTGTASTGVDAQALRERGSVIDTALQGIKNWFDNPDPANPGAVQRVYNQANEAAGGRPIPQFTNTANILGDQTNFMGTVEGEALHRGAVARAQRLGLIGDNGVWKPATVEQAERMRQWVGDQYTSRTAKMIYKLKAALDDDVAAHGGQSLYTQARNLRTRQSQMLEQPKGIADALDRDGINRKVQIEQLPDHIANLPVDQFNHVINVLKSAAHLGEGELAEPAAAALREIKGHMAARIQEAGGAKIQGGWDAKSVYQQLNKYSQKMPAVFSPREMKEWKTLNDASNTLRMDRRYPGAGAQIHNTGIAANLREQAGRGVRTAVDIAAHHALPVAGPAIVEGTGLGERLGKFVGGNPEARAANARLAEVEGRITKLNPGERPTPDESGQVPLGQRVGGAKQRGGPKFETASKDITHEHDEDVGEHRVKSANGETLGTDYGKDIKVDRTDTTPAGQGNGEGTRRMMRMADEAHARGGNLVSDVSVSPQQAKVYGNLQRLGYDVQRNPNAEINPRTGNLLSDDPRNPVFTVKPRPASTEPLGARIGGGKQRGAVGNLNKAAAVKPLEGAPEGDKPNPIARGAAAAYAKSAGIKDYKPLSEYRYVQPEVAKAVGDAYDKMEHAPNDPKVKAAYDAFKQETKAQWNAIKKTGLKVDFNQPYPYGANPREVVEDVRNNNHMTVFPTEQGFGTEAAAGEQHPMLEKSGVKFDGKEVTYNDLFRIVHDYYGHIAEGNGFRANGEYNAWRAHRTLYSDAAKPAMDSETLGQNSWVNSGPRAEANAGASQAETMYADQKAGLLPKSVVKAAEPGVSAQERHITNLLTPEERTQLRSDTTKKLIDTFHALPASEEFAAAALAGSAKRGWYANSAKAISNVFGPDAPRFAGLLASMSPQTSVEMNFHNALRTFVNWDKAGRPTDPKAIRGIMEDSSLRDPNSQSNSNVLPAWVNNAVRSLTAQDPSNIKLSGPKVHSFYHNLQNNVNEVTNDAWMGTFSKVDPSVLKGTSPKNLEAGPGKGPGYMAMSAKVRDAAKKLSALTGEGWSPREVQETVWSWAKTAFEHAEELGDRTIPDLVKHGKLTDELIRSTPDFHQLFSSPEHSGFLGRSRFGNNAESVAGGQGEGANAANASEKSKAAAKALRPALESAARRLESVRQGRNVTKEDEEVPF